MQWSASCHAFTFQRKGGVAAAPAAADSDAGDDSEGRKHDDLECRPSNSTTWSADRPREVSLLSCREKMKIPVCLAPRGNKSAVVCLASCIYSFPKRCCCCCCCGGDPPGSFPEFKQPSLLGCFAGIIIVLDVVQKWLDLIDYW